MTKMIFLDMYVCMYVCMYVFLRAKIPSEITYISVCVNHRNRELA